MDDAFAFEVAGERLVALADRALFWPARRRLVIGDLHLGKADTFRAAGIAVPSGGTAHDLARIDALIARTGADALWVLGDMLHGERIDGAWRATWDAFRMRNARLEIVVVAGNHDRALAKSGLDVEVRPPQVVDAPFLFMHLPRVASGLHAIAAHVHPVVKVRGFSGRQPCFVVEAERLIVPAFSAFTGGFLIEARSDWIACIGDCVLPSLARQAR